MKALLTSSLSEKMKLLNYEKTYFYLIMAFAFLMPLSRAAISFFIILLPLVWIIEGDFKRKYKQIFSSKLLVTIILFYFMLVLSLIYSSDIDVGLNIINKYNHWIIIIVIATSLHKKYVKHVITAFLLGMFISEIISYGVFFDIWTWKENTKASMSPFMIHIEYTMFLAFASITVFSRLLSKEYTLKMKIPMFLFFLSTTGNLFLSSGRTGQVAYIVGIIAMFFLYYRLSLKTFVYSFLTLIIIYLSAYNLSNTFYQRVSQANNDIQIALNGDFNSSWGIRAAYWIITYDILKEDLFLGVGVGDYKDKAAFTLEKDNFKYMSNIKDFVISHHFHNQYLMILVSLGLFGGIIILYIMYQSFKIAYSINNLEYRNILFLFLTIFFVSCLAEPLFIKHFSSALWVLFLGIIALYSVNFREYNE